MKATRHMKHLASSEFEAWAESYDRSLLNHFLFRPSYLAFIEEIVRWRGLDGEPFELLDIGCGTGTLAAMLMASSLPVRVVGLDYAESMAVVASRKAAGAHAADRARFTRADSEHLPFADGSFDVVTCSNSFHHYPHQQLCVNEMRRVLRPGGRLMLIDGFRDNVIGWVTFDLIIGAVEKEVHHASWSQFHTYFQEAGFQNIHRRKINILFPLLMTIGTA
ncbi:MAG: methyltransferase domain-containing protein [Phycisphaerae bacterium]|nr:methyltransferase domain-containing protein [Phycisphaerae bacterium]